VSDIYDTCYVFITMHLFKCIGCVMVSALASVW